ncbi:MAG TPA: TadE/TadG family type IV pilus assembly protein [Candidatus Limnocylindrales bacterium]|nr:TadE/TadG family type IV pilus assembly protein [Candidatus Limnocylindrales bacterium]
MRPAGRRWTARGRRWHRREAGQSVVELSLILPVFLLLLLGILEFGMAFDHLISISYASREGARAGAALVNGGGALGCGAGQSPNAAGVDAQVIAAVERVLTSPGSQVALDRVTQIRIYQASSTGAESGSVNVWTYTPGTGPVVDSSPLDFTAQSSAWTPCSRVNTLPAPSIGVGIRYRYAFSTPLGGILGFFGGGGQTGLDVTDRSVMAMNPTQ